ncbi:hypothetical protein SAMN04488523_10283 [Sulfitobacter brevis]|uniref:Uncharacterized protein n=1 Tax=Sulfitobacter brevis TaxID=74348 RepID=A0A1I1UDN9_9RHOB|nr:hypothetical protein [Sulfitobacter brevis]SFD68956.1 hypothetical protein SAMN04488523_10283 [Sulfitobacter brevis]
MPVSRFALMLVLVISAAGPTVWVATAFAGSQMTAFAIGLIALALLIAAALARLLWKGKR